MRKHNKIRFTIITIVVVLLILPYFLVPSINSELIWVSPECFWEPWMCPPSDSLSLPNNDFIQNKYDIKVYSSPHVFNTTYSITFNHLGTEIKYIFNYTLTMEEYIISSTLVMIPGEYDVYGDLYIPGLYQIWEHGVIPPGFECLGYLASVITSTAIVLIGNIIVYILKMKYQSREG